MTIKEHEVWFCPKCRGPNDEFAEACEYCGAKFKKRVRSSERVVIDIAPKPVQKRRVIQRQRDWKPYQQRDAIWTASRSDTDDAIARLQDAESRYNELSAKKVQEAKKLFNIYAGNFHELFEPEEMSFASYGVTMLLLMASFVVVIILPMVLMSILAPTVAVSSRVAIFLTSWTVGAGALYFGWQWYLDKRQRECQENQSEWKVVDVQRTGAR